jgi:predicted nucleotidyltransferase
MSIIEPTVVTSTVETTLGEVRARIEVKREELVEAEDRRDNLSGVLRTAFPGARIYINGSIAHRDALNPLSDVDLGVVVPDPDGRYGPGKEGPAKLQETAAEAIRSLRDEYPKLRVETVNHRRAILVRFGEPVTAGELDFTADVIVAIDNSDGAGLYIPNCQQWDRSHPEMHTQLVTAAILASDRAFSHGTRLMKHWNRRHDRPICSWNIKALALQVISGPMSMADYIQTWLGHAIEQLARCETPDPAGVAGPIKMNKSQSEVLRELRDARDIFDRALMLDREGNHLLAVNELAKFFKDPDVLPWPDQSRVRELEAARFKSKNYGAPASALASSSTTALASRINTQSWSC